MSRVVWSTYPNSLLCQLFMLNLSFQNLWKKNHTATYASLDLVMSLDISVARELLCWSAVGEPVSYSAPPR
jgi:hypothetical protein